jgi:uncharacterized protein (UPF0333 family)
MSSYKIILLLVMLCLCGVAYFLFGTRQNSSAGADQSIPATNAVSAINIVDMKKDSFTQLLSSAYGSLVNVQTVGNDLLVNTVAANQVSADIFNGATALLGDHSDYGFSINYNNSTNTTSAKFPIKSGIVRIPNDVVFAAMQKLYKQKTQ